MFVRLAFDEATKTLSHKVTQRLSAPLRLRAFVASLLLTRDLEVIPILPERKLFPDRVQVGFI